ncbi:MAG: hypothetical protein KAG94_05785 [Clostridiales bacterium]|nr:hypothetical protein [Clostridiales bacterium]
MNWINYYKRINNKISTLTPLYFDCGELCNKLCCQDNGKGMILFPHEKEYIDTLSTDFTIIDKNNVNTLFCTGICKRETRPIACVIYPLFPYLYEDGRLDLKKDIRGKNSCPLYYDDIKELSLQPLFRLKLFALLEEMIKEEEIHQFLRMMTDELLTIEKFTK